MDLEIKEQSNHLSKYNININKAMFILVLSIFIDMLGYGMILPLLPEVAETFGVSDFWVGLLISSNAIATLIFSPLWGKLSDKFGRKPILIFSEIGTLVSFLILGISSSYIMILFSRILDGCVGGIIPVVRAYVTDLTTPKTRSVQIAKISVATSASIVIGPILGGFLGSLNWRFPPLMAVILTGFSIVLSIFKIVESMPKERIKDLKEDRESDISLLNKKFWNKEIALRLIQIFVLNIITVLFISTIPLIMDERYGSDPSIIGVLMSIVGGFIIIYAGFLMKRIIKKFGEKKLLILSLVILILTFSSFPFLTELWMAFLFALPFGFCVASIQPLLMNNVTKAVEADKQGVASGWATNIQSLSRTFSPLIGTGFLEIGLINLLGFTLDPYFLIGLFTVSLGIILSLIIYYDFKKHKNLYKTDF
ncbi:MAG: MFS transporter [Promethearchaeota archaeon]|nr:MAG: MFS transporter [Candidatus Lokiarchaeota archaeon]